MVEHVPSLISTNRTTGGLGYRGVCSCSWRGRIYPMDKRQLAEDDIKRHEAYTASVARLTERQAP